MNLKKLCFTSEFNLDDYFFHKGVRIEKTLIQDLYCAPIVLASGYENNTQLRSLSLGILSNSKT